MRNQPDGYGRVSGGSPRLAAGDSPAPVAETGTPSIVKSIVTGTTRIELRSDTLQDDDLVLIHMGAGALETVVEQVLGTFDIYRGLESESGLFCVSVFGVTNGVSKDDILAALPHKQYGQARYGDIKHLAGLLPTSIVTRGEGPGQAQIQRSHFDLVLDGIDPADYAGQRLDKLPEDQLAKLRHKISDAISPLLAVFQPRIRKETEL